MLLLGKGGRMVYLGPSRLALPYFDTLGFSVPPHENPAGEAVPGVVGGGGAWPRRHARSSLAGTVPPAGPQLAVVTLPTHPPLALPKTLPWM